MSTCTYDITNLRLPWDLYGLQNQSLRKLLQDVTAVSLFPTFGTVWTVHKTTNCLHTKMYSLTMREVFIHPCSINSGSRAHLHDVTAVKGKALLRVGKAKKKKQD